MPLLTYYYTTTKNKCKDIFKFFTIKECKEIKNIFTSRVKLQIHTLVFTHQWGTAETRVKIGHSLTFNSNCINEKNIGNNYNAVK